MSQYKMEVEVSVDGWDFLVGIIDHDYMAPGRGSSHRYDSDIDYYGYDELTWDIINPFDENLQPQEREDFAEWFQELTSRDCDMIEGMVRRQLEKISEQSAIDRYCDDSFDYDR